MKKKVKKEHPTKAPTAEPSQQTATERIKKLRRAEIHPPAPKKCPRLNDKTGDNEGQETARKGGKRLLSLHNIDEEVEDLGLVDGGLDILLL